MLSLIAAWTLAALPGPCGAAPQPVTVLTVDDAIGPATVDYIRRGLAHAGQENAQLLVLRLDTPGGLDTSMRDIIKAILESPIPVATYVAPSGARAASAGTYILYASHIAAMTPGTNLGAATPVQIGGSGETEPRQPASEPAKDKSGQKDGDEVPATSPSSAMTEKQVNDAAAYIRGLAQMRGRNAEWAEQAVRKAVSLSASEALKLKVIDHMAADVPDLLRQLHGRKIDVRGGQALLQTRDAPQSYYLPDWRTKFLAAITNPSVALLLMVIGFYGLIFEFSNPGIGVPGVLGGICLLIGMYALQLLPVNYAGAALMLLGLSFMVAEAFSPSFGLLGMGGAVAFVIGAVILIDTDVPGFGIPLGLIVAVAIISALLVAGVVGMALKARGRRIVSGAEQLIGSVGEILDDMQTRGWAHIHGENWQVESGTPLSRGQKVRVTARRNLVLEVIPLDKDKGE